MKYREQRVGESAARTLLWQGGGLVDWMERGVDGSFDSALPVLDGRGCLLYERLGTQAVLLEEGRLRRKFSRSEYQSGRFDYPICVSPLKEGRQLLIHCPEEYNRLEIEELLTGTRLSTRDSESRDFFHSRLQVSPNGRWLLSAGWYWHPIDALRIFDLDKALADPESLDQTGEFEILNTDLEVQSAVFTPDSHLLIVTANDEEYEVLEEEETFYGLRAGQVGLFSMEERRMLWMKDWKSRPGSLVIGGPWAVSLYQHPRLWRWRDWALVHEWPHLFSGKQISSISTIDANVPAMAFDLAAGRFAISSSEGVSVVEFDPL